MSDPAKIVEIDTAKTATCDILEDITLDIMTDSIIDEMDGIDSTFKKEITLQVVQIVYADSGVEKKLIYGIRPADPANWEQGADYLDERHAPVMDTRKYKTDFYEWAQTAEYSDNRRDPQIPRSIRDRDKIKAALRERLDALLKKAKSERGGKKLIRILVRYRSMGTDVQYCPNRQVDPDGSEWFPPRPAPLKPKLEPQNPKNWKLETPKPRSTDID